MRAILSPYSSEDGWQAEFFQEKSLCALPIAGKPYAEHLIDLCSLMGVDGVLIRDYNYDLEFGKEVMAGHRWPLEVNYQGAALSRSAMKMNAQHKAFLGGDDVVILNGSILPMPSSAHELLNDMEPMEDDTLGDGVYLLRKGKLWRSKAPVKVLHSVKDYFDINFELMETPGVYVLPGYSAENSVYMGMNVAIMSEVDIKPPVMLCDDCCVEYGCKLSDGVIVGRNVMIDRETDVRHSVIVDHTYVGMKMELKNKIVASGRIIDPYTEVFLDMEDLGIAADIRHYERWDWLLVFEYMLACVLAVAYAVPFLLYLPFSHWLKDRLWTYKLSLDRYPKILLTLVGKGRLIKSQSAPQLPYAFCSSDLFSLLRASWQQKLDDTYYEHHRSMYLICKIIIKGLIYRSFINVIPGPDSW